MKFLVFKVYKIGGVHLYIKFVSCMRCPHDLLMGAPPPGAVRMAKCNAELLCKQTHMIHDGLLRVYDMLEVEGL